ncbi:MAG TPA: thiol-disulfide oxidoreductase DCC family protein [Lysobacter sp.]|jgi:predicted DCC family thiol-disulfide oxidoreductase YuxK|nr:thiol-disulfide oxidoreductase DCC family protein [Lysobacter sp.]
MSNDPLQHVSPGAVIVFDGGCALCNGWVKFLLRHDHRQRYRFAAMQSDSGRALLAAHGLDPDYPVSFLLIEDGRAWMDTDAICLVVAGLGGLWRATNALKLVPRKVRDPLYRLIARNRYRWFGRYDTCLVPPPEQRQRFLP